MNLDDKSLFLDAMEDVQPLKRNNDVHWHPGRNSRAPQRVDTLQLDNFLTTGYLDIVPLATPLEFKREGLQSGVLDKLPEVQAFCAALPHHGGSGACYVALRKSAQAKQETWEQHAKRSR